MGILNQLFGSAEAAANEMAMDERTILQHWQDYLRTIMRKKGLIGRINAGRDVSKNLRELKQLLGLELVDISDEEKGESEIISDLEAIEHSEKVKRVHKLEQCLGYAETKYEYVYRLMQQLHSFLKAQMHIVGKLIAGPRDSEKLILHLRQQLELELVIIKKITQIETFHELFPALARGEHAIRTMDANEKRLAKRMQAGMGRVFAKEIRSGIAYEWAITVFNAIEDRIHEELARGMFPGWHDDIDYEYVNRPEFADLARETIRRLKPHRATSEQMINAFVHIFREWYNHGRG